MKKLVIILDELREVVDGLEIEEGVLLGELDVVVGLLEDCKMYSKICWCIYIFLCLVVLVLVV